MPAGSIWEALNNVESTQIRFQAPSFPGLMSITEDGTVVGRVEDLPKSRVFFPDHPPCFFGRWGKREDPNQ